MKSALKAPIRSILKPTLPPSPPHTETSNTSRISLDAGVLSRPALCATERRTRSDTDLLINLSHDETETSVGSVVAVESLQDAFNSTTAVEREEDDGTVASNNQERMETENHPEKELRDKQKKAILERREARRKSLGM